MHWSGLLPAPKEKITSETENSMLNSSYCSETGHAFLLSVVVIVVVVVPPRVLAMGIFLSVTPICGTIYPEFDGRSLVWDYSSSSSSLLSSLVVESQFAGSNKKL